MSSDRTLGSISRTAADGTDLGQWSIDWFPGGLRCTTPDGTRRDLRASSLLDAVAEVPEAFRLAPHVIHSVNCYDPEAHPADLAERMRAVTPDLDEFLWQEPDGWDDGLFHEHLGDGDWSSVSPWLAGNLPLTINGQRLLPMSIDTPQQVHLLPFDVVGDMHAEPYYIIELAEVSASNDWGSYRATMGVLPRGFLCAYHDSEDVTVSFERSELGSPAQMHAEAFDWARGVLSGFYFQRSPTVRLGEDGDLEIVWPDGHDPEGYGDMASASIFTPR